VVKGNFFNIKTSVVRRDLLSFFIILIGAGQVRYIFMKFRLMQLQSLYSSDRSYLKMYHFNGLYLITFLCVFLIA
jgi:hypothetical protein